MNKYKICTRATDPAIRKIICAVARANGLEVCPTFEFDRPEDWPYAVLGTTLYATSGKSYINYAEVSLEQFLIAMTKPKTVAVKLNSEYTAEVNYDTKTVKVGCQEFPFERVHALYNVINEPK